MSGLKLAIKKAGSQAKLAALLPGDVRQQHVSYWLKNRVPAQYCQPIHKVTGVPLCDLRPDVFGSVAA